MYNCTVIFRAILIVKKEDLFRGQHIADTAHRLNQSRIAAGIAELAPQTAYQDINAASKTVVVVTFKLAVDFLPSQRLAAVIDQETQNFMLGGGEVFHLAAGGYRALIQIDCHPTQRNKARASTDLMTVPE